MASHATITQRVNCIFGDDHEITVEVREDNTLGNITTSCSADLEETKGLILLGTDPMKTCLGYMEAFVKHATAEVTYNYAHNPHPDYAGTMLYLAAQPISSEIAKKKEKRKRLAAEVKSAENKRRGDNLVSRRLQEIMEKHHIGWHAARVFRVLQEDDGHYTFNVITPRVYNYNTSSYDPSGFLPVADRVDGVWHVREDWEHNGRLYNRTGSWGGSCDSCGTHGNRNHDESKGHRKKLVKAMYICMQATSSEGMKIVNNEVRDEEGGLFEFKYRANQKEFIGVRLPANVKPRPSN